MIRDPRFDDIRPYYEEEVSAALHRIASSEVFPLMATYLYPNRDIEQVRRHICEMGSRREFQHDTMWRFNAQVIERSISEFSCHGLERLDPKKQYLYVSNHRDIVLDSSLLQYELVNQGFETTEITFGANLMINPLVVDIGKTNKMFRVERPGGSAREFYQKSLHLSEYIRHVIREKGESVWIAQRNGRTKNGIDATDQGIIKMFCMSRSDDKIAALSELHIVPVSVSYEWESCDVLKALELYVSESGPYTKKPGEDLNSVLTGILQPKGRVHIEVCEPISEEELQEWDHSTNNEYHKNVAQLIDHRINSAYRLYANNYIAHDLLYGQSRHRNHYDEQQREAFLAHAAQLREYDTCDQEHLYELFLGIYANPVDTHIKACR